MPLFRPVRIALFLATGAFGTVGCERPSAASTQLALLTAPKWRLSDYVFCTEARAVPGAYNPGMAGQEPCFRDDITVFGVDGTYVEDEGPLKCRPDVPQARRFKWRFLSEGRELAQWYAPPGVRQEIEYRYKILTLAPTTLVLEGWAPAYSCKVILTYTAV
ncbi:hypothetical protein [Hymenobacter segetis]|uniref:Lipoprotein n=1 Tax=Hymenobacter segetis TaxID=2025509 RepID=A0ABU9M1Y9_9BACT